MYRLFKFMFNFAVFGLILILLISHIIITKRVIAGVNEIRDIKIKKRIPYKIIVSKKNFFRIDKGTETAKSIKESDYIFINNN